jgi:hypothetical protein
MGMSELRVNSMIDHFRGMQGFVGCPRAERELMKVCTIEQKLFFSRFIVSV